MYLYIFSSMETPFARTQVEEGNFEWRVCIQCDRCMHWRGTNSGSPLHYSETKNWDHRLKNRLYMYSRCQKRLLFRFVWMLIDRCVFFSPLAFRFLFHLKKNTFIFLVGGGRQPHSTLWNTYLMRECLLLWLPPLSVFVAIAASLKCLLPLLLSRKVSFAIAVFLGSIFAFAASP